MGASEATLCNMLNISPFSYGLIIQQVYDNGSVYSPEVLDITEDALHKRFLEVRLLRLSHAFMLIKLVLLVLLVHRAGGMINLIGRRECESLSGC